MFNGVPVTPQSRRRRTSRLDRKLDDRERQRCASVSNLSCIRGQLTTILHNLRLLTPHSTLGSENNMPESSRGIQRPPANCSETQRWRCEGERREHELSQQQPTVGEPVCISGVYVGLLG